MNLGDDLKMNSTNAKDEVIIKIIGKLSLEFSEINQLKVREVLEDVLYKYDVSTQETSLITSDIEEKMRIYLAVKKLDGLSDKTLKNYEYNLLIFAECFKKPLVSIDVMDLRYFIMHRCKNMQPSSMNEQICIIKSFFSWLCEEEYIPKNPSTKLKFTKEPKRVRQPLTEEQLEILRQACRTDREKALFEFMYSTGCRLSEVVKVNKEDINWHEMTLNVIGKGNKEREVCFNVKAKILLKKYLATRDDDCEALFVTTREPIHRLGGRSIERELKKISSRTEIDVSVFPHKLRHTFATNKINSEMPPHIVQKLLGHESFSTTQIYAKVSRENILHEYRKTS